MRTIAQRLAPPLAAIALALAAGTAAAQNANSICFLIHDANDVVVYRDWTPPFDGALDYASPGRESLRARNLHFSYFQTSICQPVSMTATGAPKVSSVEAIIASIPDSRPTARGITTTTEPGGGSGGYYGGYGGYGGGGYGYMGYGSGYGTVGGAYVPAGVAAGAVERARSAAAARR